VLWNSTKLHFKQGRKNRSRGKRLTGPATAVDADGTVAGGGGPAGQANGTSFIFRKQKELAMAGAAEHERVPVNIELCCDHLCCIFERDSQLR
jgi:hypothetical protein